MVNSDKYIPRSGMGYLQITLNFPQSTMMKIPSRTYYIQIHAHPHDLLNLVVTSLFKDTYLN